LSKIAVKDIELKKGDKVKGMKMLDIFYITTLYYAFLWECTCGSTFVARRSDIERGYIKSCGCKQNNIKSTLSKKTSDYILDTYKYWCKRVGLKFDIKKRTINRRRVKCDILKGRLYYLDGTCVMKEYYKKWGYGALETDCLDNKKYNKYKREFKKRNIEYRTVVTDNCKKIMFIAKYEQVFDLMDYLHYCHYKIGENNASNKLISRL